jgi:hypothetical protein
VARAATHPGPKPVVGDSPVVDGVAFSRVSTTPFSHQRPPCQCRPNEVIHHWASGVELSL